MRFENLINYGLLSPPQDDFFVIIFCNIEKQGSFLYASNYSVGVNIFFELNKKLAELMSKQNYNVTIEETHHTQKKDAPSGTCNFYRGITIKRIIT